jgi:hypothetical protein
MKKLSWTQRKAIAQGIRAGKCNAQIAREIGVHRSTVGREIERNAESREKYCARNADDLSWQRQQEAVPKRKMLFGGVKFDTKLKVRNAIYTFYSHTHLNCLSRYLVNWNQWNPAYIRGRKKQFMPDSFYKRYRYCKFSVRPDKKFSLFDQEKPLSSKAEIDWLTFWIDYEKPIRKELKLKTIKAEKSLAPNYFSRLSAPFSKLRPVKGNSMPDSVQKLTKNEQMNSKQKLRT